jgi:hypothetical protein
MWTIRRKPDNIRRYVIKLQSAEFLRCAEQVYRRFDRMCCLYQEGACGINWGIEKCQPCRIIARNVPGKVKDKGQPRTGHEGPKGK